MFEIEEIKEKHIALPSGYGLKYKDFMQSSAFLSLWQTCLNKSSVPPPPQLQGCISFHAVNNGRFCCSNGNHVILEGTEKKSVTIPEASLTQAFLRSNLFKNL